jgi:DNA-damage-inducible protein D
MSNIKLFENKQIRSVWNTTDEKWYFVVNDVVQVLTDTPNPPDYIKKMRKRDSSLSQGWGQIVTPLLVETSGGRQKMGCSNAKGLLRIIQSIPSPKAEPFKQWLAQVGADRLEEIENPELATQRTRELYKLKGYPDDWMKNQNLRDHMTDLELIFSMLGEASTTKVTRSRNAKGFAQNKEAARIGGRIAGNALKELEKESGENVISPENYLPENKNKELEK